MTAELSHPVSIAVKKKLAVLGVPVSSSILVGVSGGVDSMALLVVLSKLGYSVTAAHVNFNLRDVESLNDALFVKQWCEEQGISHYELSQDTKAYVARSGTNVQTAARNIRYDWWELLAQTHKFDYVATAHHLDDSVETVFINLLRGTGLKGLRGIPHRRSFYIRPLLECTRKEIESFAAQYSIPFKTDSSNHSDAYQRNKLRHHVIPMLDEMTPGFYSTMKHFLQRINLEWEAWNEAFHQWTLKHLLPQQDGFQIECPPHSAPFLLRWLEDKGLPWNLAHDFIMSSMADSGQVLNYENYRLSRITNGYYFEEVQPSINHILKKPGHYSFGNFTLDIEEVPGDQFIADQSPLIEYVNPKVIQWPLHIRNVAAGDSFHPFGMSGKTKKIQDLMVDHKLEMFEKERLLLLINADHIIWVMGIRLDERARVTKDENTIFKLTYGLVDVT
jgi:tRNA(Ile)-lysidine synthase